MTHDGMKALRRQIMEACRAGVTEGLNGFRGTDEDSRCKHVNVLA